MKLSHYWIRPKLSEKLLIELQSPLAPQLPAGWLPCAIPWWPAPSPGPPGSRCPRSRSRCSRWASPRSRRSWSKSERKCWWTCWGFHCSGWETMSHSGTWGCCHQASHEAEENVGFSPPSKKRNQYHLLQEGANFTDTEFLGILHTSNSPQGREFTVALETEFACVEYTEILSWGLYSAASHTFCIFSARRTDLDLDFDLYSPHAAAPVSPVPTGALEWGCHPWASNLPGSLLPSHMPQKYPGLSSSSSAFLSSKKQHRRVKTTARGVTEK